MTPFKLLLASACFLILGFVCWRWFLAVALIAAVLFVRAMARLAYEFVRRV